MQITVFKKRKETAEGKKFDAYFTRIADEFYDLRFVESKGCEPPKTDFPCNIDVQRGDISLKKRTFEEGKHAGETFKTLFVYRYEMGDPFVDESADEIFG